MKITEASTGGVLWKKGVPEKFTNFTEKTRRWGLLLIKCHPVWPTALLKETPAQLVFFEYSKIFKDTDFEVETLENEIYSWFLVSEVIHSLLGKVKKVYWYSVKNNSS